MVGCSTESEPGGDGDGSGGSGENGSSDIEVPLGGNSAGDGDAREPTDGGRVDLSDEEVDAILNAACTGWAAEGESLPVVLQLVVDVSGSMEDPPPGSDEDDPSKWDVTREALEAAIEQLPASVSVGLLFYPNQETRENEEPGEVSDCVNTDELVAIDFLGDESSDHRTMITEAFEDAETGDLTPTYDAYTYALSESLLPLETPSEKFMLLITDGAPTLGAGCQQIEGQGNGPGDAPTQPIVDEIQAAFDDHGVRTFLIGSPGSEESSQGEEDMRPWLSEAAMLGGTALQGCQQDGPEFCHMDMTQEPNFAEALQAGLTSIAGQIIDSCTFAVPEPPDGEEINPDLTNLIITWGSGTNSLILRDDIGTCTDGWQFNAAGEVELCGATCDEVKLDAQASVSLNFGCEANDIIPVR